MNRDNNRQPTDEEWEVDPDQVETVLVGQVGPARGLVGEVLVRPLTDQPQIRFAVGETLYDEASNAYPICKYRIIKNRHCLTFSNITNRNQAEAIRGQKLYADIVAQWEVEEDAYRNEELAGLPVLSRPGLAAAGISDLTTLNLDQLPATVNLNQVTLG